jgi:7-cyano-7-deazaguanine synthase
LKCVALVSGGIDSSTMLLRLKNDGYKVTPIFINYGQKVLKRETEACEAVCDILDLKNKLSLINIPHIGEICEKLRPDKHFFPFRNLIFLTIAAFYAYNLGINRIAIGIIKDIQPFPDCTNTFCLKTKEALTEAIGYPPFDILAPLISMEKFEVIRYGMKHNFKYELTYSCYKGRKKHCGECPACISRKKAFKQAGYKDPTIYDK